MRSNMRLTKSIYISLLGESVSLHLLTIHSFLLTTLLYLLLSSMISSCPWIIHDCSFTSMVNMPYLRQKDHFYSRVKNMAYFGDGSTLLYEYGEKLGDIIHQVEIFQRHNRHFIDREGEGLRETSPLHRGFESQPPHLRMNPTRFSS